MRRYTMLVIICLTLGLAPFFPEPHIVGKLRWVAGGANGMNLIDWFDLAMHGAPWAGLLALLLWDAANLRRKKKKGQDPSLVT